MGYSQSLIACAISKPGHLEQGAIFGQANGPGHVFAGISFMQAHPFKQICYANMENFGKRKKFLDFDVA